jgi:hypothetical protein
MPFVQAGRNNINNTVAREEEEEDAVTIETIKEEEEDDKVNQYHFINYLIKRNLSFRSRF